MLKMLMFDFKDSEEKYFETNKVPDLDIKFYRHSLNDTIELDKEDEDNAVIISVFITSKITKNVLDRFKNLQVITTRSTGYNHIDITECKRRNIAVINIGDYGRKSVAQYTIGIIISMVRNVMISANDVRNRTINYEKYEGRDISKLVLGVIGTGSIGSAVCKIAHTLGMRVLAYDIVTNRSLLDYVEYVPLNEILSESDIITLHIPYNKENHHIFSKPEFELMKQGVYIINTARGELIDSLALYNAILSKKVKGAALDVIECESLMLDNIEFKDEFRRVSVDCLKNYVILQKLMSFDNVIITPHIAYNTTESVNKILNITFTDIKRYFQGYNVSI